MRRKGRMTVRHQAGAGADNSSHLASAKSIEVGGISARCRAKAYAIGQLLVCMLCVCQPKIQRTVGTRPQAVGCKASLRCVIVVVTHTESTPAEPALSSSARGLGIDSASPPARAAKSDH